MYVGCMYVVCNHAPGPSVLGSPDPRRTDRLRVKRQHPNSQSTPTSLQFRVLYTYVCMYLYIIGV